MVDKLLGWCSPNAKPTRRFRACAPTSRAPACAEDLASLRDLLAGER
jgi:hypothetical protein